MLKQLEFAEPTQLPLQLHAETTKDQTAKRDVLLFNHLMFHAQPTVMMELTVLPTHATSPTENAYTLLLTQSVMMETNVLPTTVLIEDVLTFQNNALTIMHVPRTSVILQLENASSLQLFAHAAPVKSDLAIPNWDAKLLQEYVTITTHVPLIPVMNNSDASSLLMTNCAMTMMLTLLIDVISRRDVSELQLFVTITTHVLKILQ
jgi:hypothetical protein